MWFRYITFKYTLYLNTIIAQNYLLVPMFGIQVTKNDGTGGVQIASELTAWRGDWGRGAGYGLVTDLALLELKALFGFVLMFMRSRTLATVVLVLVCIRGNVHI